MPMRCLLFTDPIYHAERYVEFDPREVVSVELSRARLLLRGSFQVTRIKLLSGGVHLLKGDVLEEIQAARR